MTKSDVYRLLLIRARMAEIQEIAKNLGSVHWKTKADIDVTEAKVKVAYQRGCMEHGGSEGDYNFCLHSVDVLAEPGDGGEMLTHASLESVAHLVSDGPCSGSHVCDFELEIPSWLAAEGLLIQGSDPSFFGLDEDGALLNEES